MYYSAFNLQAEAQQELESRKAQQFWRRLLHFGQSLRLCSFKQATQHINYHDRVDCGIQQICVERIVGSVSDNQHFDDQFNPRPSIVDERWTRIYIGFVRGNALPPIEVYKINGYYYIEDGHHRVSVARAIGQVMIEAHVISIHATDVD